MIKHKKGFTLAEVLITLLIIGVVSSLIIPALINDTQNAELQVAAKKALGVANQAYKQAAMDNGGGFGGYTSGTTLSYTKFNAMMSKLNVIKSCSFGIGSYGKCWSGNVGAATQPLNCSRWGTNSQNANYSFATADGMYWMLFSYDAATGQDWVAIDVNGAKRPNDWGKDIFYFSMVNTSVMPTNYNCSGSLLHNDGSVVSSQEMMSPFLN